MLRYLVSVLKLYARQIIVLLVIAGLTYLFLTRIVSSVAFGTRLSVSSTATVVSKADTPPASAELANITGTLTPEKPITVDVQVPTTSATAARVATRTPTPQEEGSPVRITPHQVVINQATADDLDALATADAALYSTAIVTPPAVNPDDPFPYEMVNEFGKAKLGSLSGIVFYPRRETLFAVSDKGRIIEIKPDGGFIQIKQIRKKADFEGITYSLVTERLYVAIEGEEVILEVNPANLEVEREMPIDRTFEGTILLSPKGKGIEGITFVPASDSSTNGSFYLVNQSKKLEGDDPSIVFEVEINQAGGETQARIIRYFSVGITDLSGIHYVPTSRRLHIISDANNLLLEVSLTGQVLDIYPLPGKKQEGITTDGDGNLYIAQDGKIALVRYRLLEYSNETNQ